MHGDVADNAEEGMSSFHDVSIDISGFVESDDQQDGAGAGEGDGDAAVDSVSMTGDSYCDAMDRDRDRNGDGSVDGDADADDEGHRRRLHHLHRDVNMSEMSPCDLLLSPMSMRKSLSHDGDEVDEHGDDGVVNTSAVISDISSECLGSDLLSPNPHQPLDVHDAHSVAGAEGDGDDNGDGNDDDEADAEAEAEMAEDLFEHLVRDFDKTMYWTNKAQLITRSSTGARVLEIAPWTWRHHPLMHYHLTNDTEQVRRLFEMGIHDARHHHDDLAAFFAD